MFPEMDPEAFADLCKSIAKHGVRQPVYVHKGKIIDGRHRERAGLAMGCHVPYVEWNGGDDEAALIEFVADCNLHRRDLTTGQRAAVAAEIKKRLEVEYAKRRNAPLKRGAEKPDARSVKSDLTGKSADAAAAKAGVSAGYVHAAEKIREADPELFEEVKQGRLTIPEAKRRLPDYQPEIKPPASRREGYIKALEDVRRRYQDVEEVALLESLIDHLKSVAMATV
jgi:ParB-like chromosome segregation protein Spo0J